MMRKSRSKRRIFGGRVVKLDAVNLAVFRHRVVKAVDFRQEGFFGGEAIGTGVGSGEGGQRREGVDGGDEEFAQARSEGELAGAYARGFPEADGLAFLAGADEGQEVGFEQEHPGMINDE